MDSSKPSTSASASASSPRTERLYLLIVDELCDHQIDARAAESRWRTVIETAMQVHGSRGRVSNQSLGRSRLGVLYSESTVVGSIDRWPPCATSTLRGLARSASGMVTVSTPFSYGAEIAEASMHLYA
jgi:hypothetical protein